MERDVLLFVASMIASIGIARLVKNMGEARAKVA